MMHSNGINKSQHSIADLSRYFNMTNNEINSSILVFETIASNLFAFHSGDRRLNIAYLFIFSKFKIFSSMTSFDFLLNCCPLSTLNNEI